MFFTGMGISDFGIPEMGRLQSGIQGLRPTHSLQTAEKPVG